MAADSFDQESSCSSSITIPDSSQSWMSLNLNLNLSTLSLCRRSSFSSHSLSSPTTKPHKAQQAGWEAIKGLRRQVAGGRVGLEHFKILKRVGGGDLGNVYLCQIRNPAVGAVPCYYAMKVVDREALAIRKKLVRSDMEKEILGLLDHPFLPTLYADFEASHYSCLVMEFCSGGDLYALRLRQPNRRFHLSSAKFYAAETLLALEYLHMMGIIYRDLKPENVLVREDGHIMLSDFDLSLKCDVVPKLLKQKLPIEKNTYVRCSTPSCVTPIQPVLSCFSSNKRRNKTSPRNTTTIRQTANGDRIDSDSDDDGDGDGDGDGTNNKVFFDTELVAEPINARSKSFVGTHEYLAPEVISGLGHGSAVDWWTYGVFLYEMLYGRTPFKGENNEKTLINILKQPVTFPRMSLGSAKEYEEMAKVQDLICKLLVKNPKKRIGNLKGSNEIKRHDFFKGINWALIRSVKPPLVPKELHNNKMRKSSSSNCSSSYQRGLNMPKALSKKEREAPYQIPQSHFDYF
ncbi:protein kinase PINOID 2-like [Chenopodium quinoa]|uniref:protein kinase PINOID 2-like n=1 Tax=Chenopodium quinoa TaxID=63459 RepID=UPI000B791B6C|nr:protein kinase PINOID 2-like [Chenopodium quinoa]